MQTLNTRDENLEKNTHSFSDRLEEAIKNGELKVFYQPKIESGSTRVIGAEALARWEKPDGSYIYPDEFIPELEQTGKIAMLDFFVYRHVFANIRQRLDEKKPVVPVSMNVSRVHLQDNEIFTYIKSLFREYRIPPKYTEFEVTESIYVENFEKIISMASRYRKAGGKISMDDFGSGYSSLNLLTTLPIDTIKIDKVFLKNEVLTENEKIVLTCVVEMAKKMKMDVVCEGVETEAQSWFLSLLGCDMFQGFLYSRPLPEEEFYHYLENHMISPVHSIHFSFDGNLRDDSGQYEGFRHSRSIEYCDGPFPGMKALHFPGGEPFEDCVEFPVDILKNDSFSINMWIREEEAGLWSSVYYAGYENGFCSIMPRAWDMKMSFRVKEAAEHDGWNDVGNQIIKQNEWVMVTACYDSRKHVSSIYINGTKAGILRNVLNLTVPNIIFLGGDIYSKGFRGCISDFTMYDQSLSFEQVREIYEKSCDEETFRIYRLEKEEPEGIRKMHFPLNGNFRAEETEGSLEYLGEVPVFTHNFFGKNSIYLPGGASMEHVLEVKDFWEDMQGFTISYWMKSEKKEPWVSAVYIETEEGFISDMPVGEAEKSIYRFKDMRYPEVWNDAIWEDRIGEQNWHHVVLVYRKDIGMIARYVDGKPSGMKDGCREIGRIKRIIFGGDIYQKSLQGYLADIYIFDKAMDIQEALEHTKN